MIETLLWVFSWLAFAYFVVYGVCQVTFTLIAWQTLSGYRHAQAFSPLLPPKSGLSVTATYDGLPGATPVRVTFK